MNRGENIKSTRIYSVALEVVTLNFSMKLNINVILNFFWFHLHNSRFDMF